MNWCPKCSTIVGPRHEHWGKVDYFQRPGGPWQCRWCRRELPDNNTDCTCIGWNLNA